MTSRDDDTLPLPGLSQELSVDATVDEDFIPTSQPQIDRAFKTSKTSETTSQKSTEEGRGSRETSATEIDDTLPTDSWMEQSIEKSADFIPDTETKKRKVDYSNEELGCKKKLPVFNTEDTFEEQKVLHWGMEVSKIPESPAAETENDVAGLPGVVRVKKREDSIPEIFVNDSTETVDLDATGNSSSKVAQRETDSVSCSFNSDVVRCEETQVFDNSSILLLEHQREKSVNGVTSQKLYLEDTVEDELEPCFQGVASENGADVPPLEEDSKEFNQAEEGGEVEEEKTAVKSGRPPFPQECEPLHSTPSPEDIDTSYTETKKYDFKLSVTCLVTFNAKTKKVTQKLILNVNELPKPKPKPPAYIEHNSDYGSEKSKRCSTSSSGSVYSDKTGLPFALPKRVSAASDQTDSSEDGFSKHLLSGKKVLERVPWSNEYLLPLKMDEIVKSTIDHQDVMIRPTNRPSPTKTKVENCNGSNHSEEVVESSSSERTETSNMETGVSNTDKTSNSGDVSEKEKVVSPALDKIVEEGGDEENEVPGTEKINEAEEEKQNENSLVEISEGLAVFARWTDKRYYSGVLTGINRNERWDVLFDDGTTKTVKEDFIMPAKWLKVGALVFALIDDKYESGQIIDVKAGDEAAYSVELDTKKTKVTVKRCDLCLTDVMAGIVKENFKPLVGTPKGKASSHIDFDNVLTGKRLREQRTPFKTVLAQTGSAGLKKKSSTKGKKLDAGTASEFQESSTKKTGGLKSENGHLVEDKVISADSPSGNETGETPLRGVAKETRGKAKPRSLSYETEEGPQRKTKSKGNWLTSDGIPIPGPSGVKFKRQKTKSEEAPKDSEENEAPVLETNSKKSNPQSGEKMKRKRKLDETADDGAHKKSSKEVDNVRKVRNRKG